MAAPGVPAASHHCDPVADSIDQHDCKEVLNVSWLDPVLAPRSTLICLTDDQLVNVESRVSDISLYAAMECKIHLYQMNFIPTYQMSLRKL